MNLLILLLELTIIFSVVLLLLESTKSRRRRRSYTRRDASAYAVKRDKSGAIVSVEKVGSQK